LSNKIIV